MKKTQLLLILIIALLPSLLYGQNTRTTYQAAFGSGLHMHYYQFDKGDSTNPSTELKLGLPIDIMISTFISPNAAFTMRAQIFSAFAGDYPTGITMFDSQHMFWGYKHVIRSQLPSSATLNESMLYTRPLFRPWVSFEAGLGKIELKSIKNDISVSDNIAALASVGLDMEFDIFPIYVALVAGFAPNIRRHVATNTVVFSFLVGTFFSDLF